MGEKVVNKCSVRHRLVMGSQELTANVVGNLPLSMRTSLTLTFVVILFVLFFCYL